jgi:hypothetical protein
LKDGGKIIFCDGLGVIIQVGNFMIMWPGMLVHKLASMNMSRWAWTYERTKSFLEYFVRVDKILGKYFLTHMT